MLPSMMMIEQKNISIFYSFDFVGIGFSSFGVSVVAGGIMSASFSTFKRLFIFVISHKSHITNDIKWKCMQNTVLTPVLWWHSNHNMMSLCLGCVAACLTVFLQHHKTAVKTVFCMRSHCLSLILMSHLKFDNWRWIWNERWKNMFVN